MSLDDAQDTQPEEVATEETNEAKTSEKPTEEAVSENQDNELQNSVVETMKRSLRSEYRLNLIDQIINKIVTTMAAKGEPILSNDDLAQMQRIAKGKLIQDNPTIDIGF